MKATRVIVELIFATFVLSPTVHLLPKQQLGCRLFNDRQGSETRLSNRQDKSV